MHIIALRGDIVYTCSASTGFYRHPTRGVVKEFSAASGTRLRQYLAAAVAQYWVMITLTIPSWHPHDPATAKEWLRAFFRKFKREQPWGDQSSIVWVMEFQKCGSVHFHLLSTEGATATWVARAWYEVVGTQHEHHLKAGTRIERIRDQTAASRYMAKYLSKGAIAEQTPIVAELATTPGRWWGVVGMRKTVEATLRVDSAKAAVAVERLEIRMQQMVEQGQAQRLDTATWEKGAGVTAWRIPNLAHRRAFRAWLMALKIDMNTGATWIEPGDLCPLFA